MGLILPQPSEERKIFFPLISPKEGIKVLSKLLSWWISGTLYGNMNVMERSAIFRVIVVISLAIIITGWGGGSREKIEVRELGFSMNIPSGWSLDSRNPWLCYLRTSRGDYTGTVIVEPLEGDFYEFVKTVSREFGGKVISSQPFKIKSYKAVKTVVKYPLEGVIGMGVFVLKEGRVIQAFFVVSEKDFEKYRPSLEKSLESISIR